MKAILKFDLPEEAQEHLHAISARSYLTALQEIDAAFRAHEKHDTPAPTRDVVRAIMVDNGIDLDML